MLEAFPHLGLAAAPGQVAQRAVGLKGHAGKRCVVNVVREIGIEIHLATGALNIIGVGTLERIQVAVQTELVVADLVLGTRAKRIVHIGRPGAFLFQFELDYLGIVADYQRRPYTAHNEFFFQVEMHAAKVRCHNQGLAAAAKAGGDPVDSRVQFQSGFRYRSALLVPPGLCQ